MEQKKFVKYGLTTDNFRLYIPLIVGEVKDYLDKTVFFNGEVRLCPLRWIKVVTDGEV